VAELVDAEIIPSEIQWYGESPCKILDTHYRFESCPDYKTLHNRFLFLPCGYEHTAGFLNKDVYEQKKICIFKIKNKMMELIFSSFWTFIGTIILISTCANAVAVIIKSLKK